MWMMAKALTGMLAGYLAGMLLHDLLPLIGMLLLRRPIGLSYLSLICMGIGGLIGLLAALRRPDQKRSANPNS